MPTSTRLELISSMCIKLLVRVGRCARELYSFQRSSRERLVSPARNTARSGFNISLSNSSKELAFSVIFAFSVSLSTGGAAGGAVGACCMGDGAGCTRVDTARASAISAIVSCPSSRAGCHIKLANSCSACAVLSRTATFATQVAVPPVTARIKS